MTNIEENWNRMARAYEAFTEAENSYSYKIEWPCIKSMLPDLKGKDILDLGCGTGRFTFLLENSFPNKIVGVDISESMLEFAREKARDRKSKACFIQADLNSYISDEKYDFIFSSTLTHYIEDINAFFVKCYSLLRNGGSCVISVMNPVYTAQYPVSHGDTFPKDDEWTVRYLDKRMRSYIQPWIEYNDEIENFLSSSYHYTFSEYVSAVIRAGFTIEEVQEPAPPEEWKTTKPGRYEAFIKTPSYLIMRLKK